MHLDHRKPYSPAEPAPASVFHLYFHRSASNSFLGKGQGMVHSWFCTTLSLCREYIKQKVPVCTLPALVSIRHVTLSISAVVKALIAGLIPNNDPEKRVSSSYYKFLSHPVPPSLKLFIFLCTEAIWSWHTIAVPYNLTCLLDIFLQLDPAYQVELFRKKWDT